MLPFVLPPPPFLNPIPTPHLTLEEQHVVGVDCLLRQVILRPLRPAAALPVAPQVVDAADSAAWWRAVTLGALALAKARACGRSAVAAANVDMVTKAPQNLLAAASLLLQGPVVAAAINQTPRHARPLHGTT